MTPAEITALRKSARLDQAEVAAAMGISRETVGRYERGVLAVPPWYCLALQRLAQVHAA